jgi:hypothetical protein
VGRILTEIDAQEQQLLVRQLHSQISLRSEKMRDAYSLLIRSVEHINKLFENDAIPERLV